MKNLLILGLAAGVLAQFVWAETSRGASFTPLGDLPGGRVSSAANAVAADGSTVVGVALTEPTGEAFIWDPVSLMRALGAPPRSSASGVSGDGSIVVGDTGGLPYRWDALNGVQILEVDLPGGDASARATAISDDGSTVVGRSSAAAGYEAFRLSASNGLEGLGDLSGGTVSSTANAVSADGAIVVGYSRSGSGDEAFRWDATTGIQGLGDLLGGSFYSSALDLSADGSIVVGESTNANGGVAFIWDATNGMRWLGALPGPGFSSSARAVSADGSVVVGFGTGQFGERNEAFIWDPVSGMQFVRAILAALGADVDGWHLEVAHAVSADGRTIAGYGTNPNGDTEAFVAVISEPFDDWDSDGVLNPADNCPANPNPDQIPVEPCEQFVFDSDPTHSSYQQVDGTTVPRIQQLDPPGDHPYTGRDLVPGIFFPSIPIRNADLALADLAGATLTSGVFRDSNLAGADLSNADLVEANLHNANLAGANLSGADLGVASFYNTNLTAADLTGANLEGADLRNAELSSAILTGAVYSSFTQFPAAFDPVAAGMTTAGILVINNGLAPPNPENVVDVPWYSDLQVRVNNEGCNALVEYPCSSPGQPTVVSGTAQTITVHETSSFDGIVGREVRAVDSATVTGSLRPDDSKPYGFDTAAYAYGSSSIVMDGVDYSHFESNGSSFLEVTGCYYHCSLSAKGQSFAIANGSWNEGISADDQAHLIYQGGTDEGNCVYVLGDALVEIRGYAWCLVVHGGRAVLYPGANEQAGVFVYEGGLLDKQGGSETGWLFAVDVEGSMIMTAGSLTEEGLTVSGYAAISGGTMVAAPEPTTGYYGVPGPWNFIAEAEGLIDLSGGTIGEHVSLAARDSSKIRIFGSAFAVDGVPVAYGPLTAQQGKLSGLLESGDPIDNAFAQQGGTCGEETCSGTVLVLKPGIDWDDDQIENGSDNCADVPNPGQGDADADGIGDACNDSDDGDGDEWADLLDNCPGIANADQGDADGNGTGDACNDSEDADGDEWADVLDTCPQQANPGQEDADADGIGNACNDAIDLDGDDWADPLDNCLYDGNGDQSDADADGIGDLCDFQLRFWVDKGPKGCSDPPDGRGYRAITADLSSGEVIVRDEWPCDCFGIELPPEPNTSSVRFTHLGPDGTTTEICENFAPFALGLSPGQNVCAPELAGDGPHAITATPYDADGCETGGGQRQPSSSRQFVIAGSARPVPLLSSLALGLLVGSLVATAALVLNRRHLGRNP